MDYQIISDTVLKVFLECDIHDFPVNCIEILQHYNFRLFTYNEIKIANPELHEIAKEFSDDAFKYGNIICFNDSMPKGRIRFSLMHELGHYLLGHTETSRENENEADYFASCILAPRIAIRKTLCRTADDIHDTFGLSYAASNHVLADYKRWSIRKKYSSERELYDYLYPKEIIVEHVPDKTPAIHKKLWRELENKHRFIEEHICSLEEYAFREREYQIYNGM